MANGDKGFFEPLGRFLFGGGRAENEFRDVDPAAFGIPGFEEELRRRNELAGQGPRVIPTVGPSGFRGGQATLAGQLQEQAAGRGPSLANEAFRQSLQAGTAQQQALAATGRGNAALGARQAAGGASSLAGQLAGQRSLGRIQEQLGARQQLGGLLGQARGQDIQRGEVNLRGTLEGRRLDDERQRALLQQALDLLQQQQLGGIEAERARTQRFTGLLQAPTLSEQGLGAVSSGIAQIATKGKKPPSQ